MFEDKNAIQRRLSRMESNTLAIDDQHHIEKANPFFKQIKRQRIIKYANLSNFLKIISASLLQKTISDSNTRLGKYLPATTKRCSGKCPRERTHRKKGPEKISPGKLAPGNMPPGKLPLRKLTPWKNGFTRFLLLLTLSYSCSF